MKFIAIDANGIVTGEDGLCLEFTTCKSAETIAKKCQQILPKARYLVPDVLNASPEIAWIEIKAAQGRPDLTANCLQDAIGLVLAAHRDFVTRYAEAVADERPVRRVPLDSAVECLNRTAWSIEQIGGHTRLAPDCDFAEDFCPVDPATLRAPMPADAEDVAINSALVIGCREIQGNQSDMFRGEDAVEVVISLVGSVPEVRLRTTRAEAQSIYRGANRLTANARVENRMAIPAVVGEYSISK